MSLHKNIQLGLLHVAVAITFVLINGVLNRIMIADLRVLASVVAALVVIPYLLSPTQIWIGQYSDKHPLFGLRRTPYIILGMLLCIGGAWFAPRAAFAMAEEPVLGLLLCALAFGAWGMGFNVSVVAYLALANDLSPEHQRQRTIAVMWFMMICSIILTAILTSRALREYSPDVLMSVFDRTCAIAFSLVVLGLAWLEPRQQAHTEASEQRLSHRFVIREVIANPQARRFFIYLIVLLAAILGQDVLLEPYGALVFDMDQAHTTRLTSVWGTATLIALLLDGFALSRWLSKKRAATIGGVIAALGLVLIALAGIVHAQVLFVPGVAILGFGTGISTASNLALMLDMTLPEQAGLFIGAWGVADALARGVGTLLGGVVRDAIDALTGSVGGGFVSVFLIEAALVGVSLFLLRAIDASAFRKRQTSVTEIMALAGDV